MSQSNNLPTDFITREQAAQEFGVTINQLRHMARRGEIHNYRRGNLRGIWVSRGEVAAAVSYRIVSPDEDDDDGDDES